MKKSTLYKLIFFLSVMLVVCLIIAGNLDEESDPQPQMQASTSSTESSTIPTTVPSSVVTSTPAASAVPTIPPFTQPPATKPGLDYIGNLYTRDQLEAMDTKMIAYGTGKEVDSKNRPVYPINMTQKYQKYDAYFIAPDNGKIYLTFNVTYESDGYVQKTLNILKEQNVQAVFFIDKAFARLWPALVQQIIDDGHVLANHCTTHPELPKLSIDKIAKQITDIHDYVKENFGYEMRLFRPPSGYFSEQVLAIAQSLGYRSYNWSFTYQDWDRKNQPKPATALKLMTDSLHSGAIYQLHAISSTNATILPDFVAAARSAGYEFALLS